MVNLEKLFTEMANGVMSGDDRYVVVDGEHINDKLLNIEYHLYQDWRGEPFKLKVDGKQLLDGQQLTNNEASILCSVRDHANKMVTDDNRKKLYDMSLTSTDKPEVNSTEVKSGNGGYK